ncbi:hypothetical protein BH11MYX3_BH11MYX3_38600 [soil metagenome]
MIRSALRLAPFACVLALAGGVAAEPAANHPDGFTEGRADAARGEHTAAISSFERDLEQSGWSAGTLTALADEYAAIGEPGRAVLALERARVLVPDDAGVAERLAHAREAAGVSAMPTSRIERMAGTLEGDSWAWIGIAGLALACAGIVARGWSSRRPLLTWSMAAIGGAIAVVASGAAMMLAPDPQDAIVVTATSARVAPAANAEAVFAAAAGDAVRIERSRGDQIYVRSGDQLGWLPADHVERIVPLDQ